MNVIPKPLRVSEKSGRCILPEVIAWESGGFDEYVIFAFSERMNRRVEKGDFIRLVKDGNLADEEYRLDVNENGIVVEAATERGVIWALTTVANMLENGEARCVEIEDKPKYAYRGLSLDCVRHFFDAEEVKKVIEGISLAKINVLHWHLTDDQGWRIESKKFPRLNEISGRYFTHEEIRDVVRFAKTRGVEVIPEIDMPGHMTALLAAFPQYGCSGKEVKLATCGGVYSVILCAGKEQTYALIDELFEEILPLFDSDTVHIGGDEAPKGEWKKCPDCKKKMHEEGLSDFNELQGYFTGRVCEILKKYGKKAICWNETALAKNHPQDITVQYWTLNHRKSMERYVKNGGKWIYSEMFDFYLDYPHSMISLERLYGTKVRLGRRDYSDDKGLTGMECCLWAEQIAESERLEKLVFPRIFAMAEISWSEERDYKDFEKRLKNVLRRGLYSGLRPTEAERWNPEGKARKKEAVDFFVAISAGINDEMKEQTASLSMPSFGYLKSFMTKFLRFSDLPSLLKALIKK